MNWKTHELSFRFKGNRVNLFGNDSLHQCECEATKKSWVWWTCREILLEAELFEVNMSDQYFELSILVEHVLEMYLIIFAEFTQLLFLRDWVHVITLIAGAGPISVRHYQYIHAYKEETDSQMTKFCIVSPNRSPYSGPVLLVKKKERTWRFSLTIEHSIRPVADKYLIQWLINFWMNYLDLVCSLSWAYVPVIIKYECNIHDISKTALEPRMAIMNLWLCS